jgi:outer membrane protein OmpA-like peptidoglycan-associated protein
MIAPRRRAFMAVLAVAALVSACAPKTARTDPQAQVLVVLLPDTDTGNVGRIVVSNPAGQTELSTAYASTRVTTNGRQPRARTMKQDDVMRQFADAIGTLPPAPLHFTLFFRFDSEELTDESRAVVQDVLKSVKAQPVPDVQVIGHTDTTGTAESNFELGMRRANSVRAMLIEAGLNPSAIDARSFGEMELLVKTANGVFEPKNRRVDITVR